jgi:histidine decarboxylase
MDFSRGSLPITAETPRVIQDICCTQACEVPDIINGFVEVLKTKSQHHLGYPYNLGFDYGDLVEKLGKFSINNLGDPFIESNYGVHSRAFEIAVLDWFADLWSIGRREYWGYVTACGTEGNLQGIYMGRENLSKTNCDYDDIMLLASCESHYSVFKAAKMYCIHHEMVYSNPDGSINLQDFKGWVDLCVAAGKKIIVNVNIGTTMKGGIDDLDGVVDVLRGAGMKDDEFYIHCDGALAGIMIGLLEAGKDILSFSTKPIGSISVSGHKFIGSPVPCGVFVTRLRNIEVLSSNVDYINSRDATIMGSRNGHAALYIWYALVHKGVEGLRKDVQECISNARFLADAMDARGAEDVFLGPLSCTVVFKAPSDALLVHKWQLACSGGLAHVVVMPNLTQERLLEFVEEYYLSTK